MSRQKLFRVVEIMGGWENARKYLNLHVRVFHWASGGRSIIFERELLGAEDAFLR